MLHIISGGTSLHKGKSCPPGVSATGSLERATKPREMSVWSEDDRV